MLGLVLRVTPHQRVLQLKCNGHIADDIMGVITQVPCLGKAGVSERQWKGMPNDHLLAAIFQGLIIDNSRFSAAVWNG